MVGFFRASYCPVNLGPSELTTYILLPINNLFWCLCYKLSVFNLQCLSGFYHFLLVLISKIYIYFFSREKDYSDINNLLREIHVFFFFFSGFCCGIMPDDQGIRIFVVFLLFQATKYHSFAKEHFIKLGTFQK